MAELVLSTLLPVVFEKLASDASEKEVTDEAVKLWLNRLQHFSYDIDDFLDGLATDAMHHKFTNESEGITSRVRKLIPICCTNFSLSTRMGGKLDSITNRLQELIDEENNLGLSVKDGGSKSKNRYLQTSLVDASSIVGREGDKKELLQKLLADEPNFSIVPIVGMGGIGKTTLARLLYDDQQVKDRFELKAWVCVSDDFDSFNISKVVYQEVGGEQKDFSEKLEDWETLAAPFSEVARGSKIIITTRKQQLLNKLGYDHPYDLKTLSDDDALSLFARYAGINDFESYPMLRLHGEGIIKKCDGLPLALKALGSSLRGKTDEEDWKQLLNNEIWMLEDGGGIVPALRLSYHDLAAPLKHLFAYCCLIPKDYVFEKKDLILLWMAEGFLHNSATNKTMECLGDEYFQELLSRSFFQHVPDDESLFVMHDLMNDLATFVAGEFFSRLDIDMKNVGEGAFKKSFFQHVPDDESLFVMHDLMNDLATFVAGEFFSRLDIDMKNVGEGAFKKYRHMSFVCERYMTYNKFKAFERANSLRTFLAMPTVVEYSWQRFYLSSKILVDILPQLQLLRVLSLSGLNIDEVPKCVGNMKHLRYLNLSQTRIKHLPERVCNLYNLQTLILCGCDKLTKLPKNFLKLKNLRHFDIRDTSLWNMMPLGIREFKSLQILFNQIDVITDDRFISGLKNLQGKISIQGLQKVQSARDIQELNLSQKKVSKLHMGWVNVFDDSRNEKLELEVLHALKPHSDNLKDLVIQSYGGKLFPNWIGDPSFLRLTSVRIENCEIKLVIEKLSKVKVMRSEFLGRGTAFPKLESLRIEDMRGWEVWSTKSGVVGAVMFPCLQELSIKECPNLVEVSLEALPSLRVLNISHYGDGVLRSLVRVASSVTKLSIWSITGLSDEVWRGVMDYLGAVEELWIRDCHEIRYLWESEAEASKVLVNLRKLEVLDCSKLVSLGEKEKEEDGCNQLTSLRILVLGRCKNLERCNLSNNIQELKIIHCDLIASVSFPTGGHKLKSLEIIGCQQLLGKEVLLNTSMPSVLELVRIFSSKNLKSINELTCFIHLTELTISDCSSIESFPAANLPNLTSLTNLIIVNCKSMDVDSFGLWPPNLGRLDIGGLKKPISKFGPQNFPPSLVDLQLFGGSVEEEDDVTGGSQLSHMLPSSLTTFCSRGFKKLKSAEEEDDVTSGSQLSHMLPSSLTHLRLRYFEKLETFSKGLQHLASLQYLDIYSCPKMKDLPEELLPSLLGLGVYDGCTDELKEKTSRRGSYWPLISYIPDVTDCGYFDWLDQPMCARSVQIIPGLLWLRNIFEESLNSMAATKGRLKICLVCC
ncbi:NBS-LRR resistance-like protein [Artemisia annua]|uniref:NBS-LRR resistance-like protein n=1 Tax=Artemisia annua TaxID=35608 RepID=A0A2U1KGD2_ARTAN|nr:NBS-LRR resistance-like protein [Artemisia annua]